MQIVGAQTSGIIGYRFYATNAVQQYIISSNLFFPVYFVQVENIMQTETNTYIQCNMQLLVR